MAKKTPELGWTGRDTALWQTCEIAYDIASRRKPTTVIDLDTSFPPSLGPGERLWAAGQFQLFNYQPIGDGSYIHNSGWFFATGGAGLLATAGFAAARASGNRSRRDAAAAAAQPRWTPIESGTLMLGSHGLYMHTMNGLWPWGWPAFTSMSMMAAGTLHVDGNSDRGSVSWILESEWSELAFIMWALHIHPKHPQLRNGEWLPSGWLEYAAGHFPTRLGSPALALP